MLGLARWSWYPSVDLKFCVLNPSKGIWIVSQWMISLSLVFFFFLYLCVLVSQNNNKKLNYTFPLNIQGHCLCTICFMAHSFFLGVRNVWNQLNVWTWQGTWLVNGSIHSGLVCSPLFLRQWYCAQFQSSLLHWTVGLAGPSVISTVCFVVE